MKSTRKLRRRIAPPEEDTPDNLLNSAVPILMVGVPPSGRHVFALDAGAVETPSGWGIVLADILAHVINV